ncbi:MAG TPA: hypothetical protein DCF68_04410 [Cyanothece sp. UBA12306]|nr:hypothetical protein [Cyanothece sp. UBA12306]
MTLIVTAKSGLSIRLTEERWQHIKEGHPELAELQSEVLKTIEDPDRILAGNQNELLAVKLLKTSNKYLVAIYKELDNDGFIITAYLTRRINSLNKMEILWSKQR